MKKKILYAAALLLLAWAAQSCEALGDCQFCRMVMTDTVTGDKTYGNETEYCGAELLAIKATPPVTTGQTTTTWECR